QLVPARRGRTGLARVRVAGVAHRARRGGRGHGSWRARRCDLRRDHRADSGVVAGASGVVSDSARLPFIGGDEMNALRRLLTLEHGQDLLEYALLASLIAIFAVAAVKGVGDQISSVLWGAIANNF